LDGGSARRKASTRKEGQKQRRIAIYIHVPRGIPTHGLNNLRINTEAHDVSFRTNFARLFPFTGTDK
jgi:hypothetical protein